MNSVLDPQIVVDFLRGLSEQQLAGVFGSLGVLLLTAIVPVVVNTWRALSFGTRTTYRAGRWVAGKTYDAVRTKPSRIAAQVLDILENEKLTYDAKERILRAPAFRYTHSATSRYGEGWPEAIKIAGKAGDKPDCEVLTLLSDSDKKLVAAAAKKRITELNRQDVEAQVQLSEEIFAARKANV